MPDSVKDLMARANDAVPHISVDEAQRLIATDDAALIDVRDAPEVEASGALDGAINISRGMIEFRADVESSYHDPALRPDRPVILYCASGGRSALAGKTLRDMGYARVFNLGGFKDAAAAGMPVRA
ncbi:MAG: rhodanese-like domain-containing protein [Sphingomonas sp.]